MANLDRESLKTLAYSTLIDETARLRSETQRELSHRKVSHAIKNCIDRGSNCAERFVRFISIYNQLRKLERVL